jgi:aspartyl-tRNA(Asn)/glutamyl-tRNA(Gln) amidotransferase subunit A
LLEEGTVTCLQAVEHYLQQIQARQHLNAFVNVYADEAIARAKELDEKRKRGGAIAKLHGVVIGIKDVIAYKDHPLSASSKILKGFSSIYSASAVKKLLDEEAIIIGHLNCDEFAMALRMKIQPMGKF